MGRLSGKVAIVTGGAQGQGAAIVRGFVAEGAKVVIADIATDEGELLAKEIGEDVVFVRHDVDERVRLGVDGRRPPRSGSARSTCWSTTPAS